MATNTSATSQNHNGTGSQANFAISFPFLLNSEIKVTVGGTLKTLGTHYNIVGSEVQFTSGNLPASGTANVVFNRDTNISTKRVDFEDGSVLTEADLDNNVNQVLFAQQEITDKLSGIEEGATADQTASDIKTLIASSPLDNSHLANNAVGTSEVADDAITADKLANSINTDIANNTAKVTNATHTGDVTGSGALTIAQDAVTTSKIAADAIVGAKIADNAISSEHYTDGSIETVHIADDAITAAKLANTSVTAGTYNTANITVDAQGRITSAAAGTANITDGQITTAKLADDAVTTDKLANSIVSDITANNAKVTNVTTNLTTTTATGSVTVNSSDGTNATIGEATSSAAGVMSTAHHDKLDGIEANATADQTNAEIKTAYEANSNTNAYTDAEKSKLTGIEAAATADQTASEIKTLLQSDKLTASEIATGALDGRYYTETESDARYFNVSSGDTITSGDTFPDNDTTIATTKAINARILDLVDEVGGFVPIANETSFPNTNPDAENGTGTIVSVSTLASNHTSNSSGVITISNGTVGNSTVTITGAANSTTYSAGYGLLVETTSTLNTYTFHRLVPKATEVTTVATNATNIAAAGANTTNINTVAGNNSNINTVAGISGNVTTVAGISSNVTSVANNTSNINAVAADATDIGAVAGKATEIGRLGTADAVADLAILGTTDVVSDMNTLATSAIVSDMDTLADISSNITTVAGISANVTTVAGNNSNINTVAGANSNISTVAGSISNVNTVASNISNVSSFANTYQIASSNPSTDGGGNSLAAGDLYFNTSSNELRVYNGSAWQGGVTATGNLAGLGANTFTGNQTISSTLPKLILNNTSNNPDYEIRNFNGKIQFHDITNSATRLEILSNGLAEFKNDVDIEGNLDVHTGLDVTGNITVSGTVDGVDIAALNSTVAGITSNATHTGEVTGSGALTIADNVVDEANLKVSNSPTNGYFLQAQSGNTGGLTWAAVSQPDSDKITEGNTEAEVVDTGSDGHFKVTTEGSERLRVNSDGKLMLNTTTVGSATAGKELIVASSSGNAGVTIRCGNNDNSLLYFADGTSGSAEYTGFIAYDHAQQRFSFGTEGSTRLRIDGSGHFLPAADSTYNIGSNSVRFANGYFDTLYGDGSNLTGIAAGVLSYDNVAVGNSTLASLVSNTGKNVAIGSSALNATTTGEYNTAVGYGAGTGNTTGQYNIAIGLNTLQGTNTASGVVAIGGYAVTKNTSGAYITGVGYAALSENTTGDSNTAFGNAALSLNTTGTDNTAVGRQALRSNTTGQYNTATGYLALYSNTTAESNTAVGHTSLYSATTGGFNTAIGKNAMYATTEGVYNVAVGINALDAATTTNGCTAVGGNALGGVTTGDGNTAIGKSAGLKVTTGTNNTFLGHFTGWGVQDLTTGSNNTLIGYYAQPSSGTVSNEVTVGNTSITKFRVPAIGLEAEDGILSLKTGSGSVAEARFYCESSNAHYVAIKSPAHSAYSGNVSFVLPPNGGTNGYFLKTDGSGNTSWAEAGGVGGSTGVDFDDNVKIRLGTGNDFEIFHNQVDNIINGVDKNLIIKKSNNKICEFYRLSSSNYGVSFDTGKVMAGTFHGDGSALTNVDVTKQGVFYENAQTVSSNYTVTNGSNAMAAGPITIASGVTVEVGADETLTIV